MLTSFFIKYMALLSRIKKAQQDGDWSKVSELADCCCDEIAECQKIFAEKYHNCPPGEIPPEALLDIYMKNSVKLDL